MKKGHEAKTVGVRKGSKTVRGSIILLFVINKSQKRYKRQPQMRYQRPQQPVYMHWWGRIALQTAQGFVTADNGHQSVRCRIMFDSGSQKSYISTELADLLKVTPKTTEHLEICGFGKEGATVKGRVFDVEVETVNKKNPIFREICEVPTIAKFQNVHAEIVKSNYEHLTDLGFSDVTDKDTSQIRMLIGADSLWQFQQGEI